MNRLKGILYEIVGWLAGSGMHKKPTVKKLLIVRIDEIGDYMLWHSFLKEIITSEKFKGYIFHFCGNQSCKKLFDVFDATDIDNSFWIDKTRFKKDMRYRFSLLKKINGERYDAVINPTFSRDKRYDDSIVKAAKANETWGMVANTESVHDYETGYDKGLYTHLFDHPAKPVFEFLRNKLFAEFVTGQPSSVMDTKVNTALLPSLSFSLPGKYFVVFPGSRSASRIWPAGNFVRVSNYLFENYGWTAVVCGTKSDEKYISAFCDQYKHPVMDLTGKTSLTDMLSVFKNAECLLSVDTGSVHLAAAVGCTVFGIFNGSQYKRFAPYPAALATDFHAIYPDAIEKELADEELVKKKYEFVVKVPYASVPAEKVIHVIYGSDRK